MGVDLSFQLYWNLKENFCLAVLLLFWIWGLVNLNSVKKSTYLELGSGIQL